jgi:hypothetical protein
VQTAWRTVAVQGPVKELGEALELLSALAVPVDGSADDDDDPAAAAGELVTATDAAADVLRVATSCRRRLVDIEIPRLRGLLASATVLEENSTEPVSHSDVSMERAPATGAPPITVPRDEMLATPLALLTSAQALMETVVDHVARSDEITHRWSRAVRRAAHG